MQDTVKIHPLDNVLVALTELPKGAVRMGVTALEAIPAGHKMALQGIAVGESVVKYGNPIGRATASIPAGAWVHTHNVKTLLTGAHEYAYEHETHAPPEVCPRRFLGYARADGGVGVRNEIWIIPTVGCVSLTAQRIAEYARARFPCRVDGFYAFSHVHGCSQMGGDQRNTQNTLAALTRHPNAGGVLVLGLGCENNHIAAFREVLGETDPARVKFLACQDVEDEYEAALTLLDELSQTAAGDRRVSCPASKLVLGLKCGGSDGFSGITANPLLGALSDRLCALGGTTLLTEVPEMFGAEQLLMRRCVDPQTFEKTVRLINDYKDYFKRYGQPVSENPSPGNKAGGLTTLEDKSLGCTQKGGLSPVTDVLPIGARACKPGLALVNGPGNDLCATTALACAGAQLVLFTTGRGTPYGGAVPTLKIATNSALASKKPHWIDFDAGRLLSGETMDELCEALFALVLETANGQPAKNETGGYREIAVFKDGVTL